MSRSTLYCHRKWWYTTSSLSYFHKLSSNQIILNVRFMVVNNLKITNNNYIYDKLTIMSFQHGFLTKKKSCVWMLVFWFGTRTYVGLLRTVISQFSRRTKKLVQCSWSKVYRKVFKILFLNVTWERKTKNVKIFTIYPKIGQGIVKYSYADYITDLI